MTDEQRSEMNRRWDLIAGMIGQRYADCRFENFNLSTNPEHASRQRAVLSDLQHATNPPVRGQNILFFGPAGAGKDHLATAALHSVVMRGVRARWVNGAKLLTQLRSFSFDDAGAEQDLLNRFSDPSILLISDPVPPVGDLTPFQAGFLLQMIDQRYRNNLATWATLNFASRTEANNRMGPQLVDRLMDGAVVLDCNWSSYRKPASIVSNAKETR